MRDPGRPRRARGVLYASEMVQALVAVEIAPPDAAAPLKQSLLDACGRAAEERCAEPQGEQEPNVVAIVSWADPLHARLEVALRREQRWVVRTMGFGAQDAPKSAGAP